METAKKTDYTFIQEQVSQTAQEQIEKHMDKIGQTPTADPQVFEVAFLKERITAYEDVLDMQKPLPMHSHTFMEVFYYTNGSNVACLVGPQRYLLQKGDIVFIPPGVFHCTLRSNQHKEPCIRYMILLTKAYTDIIEPKVLNEIFPRQQTPYLLRTEGTDKAYLGQLFEICVRETSSQAPHWRDITAGCVNIIMAQAARMARSGSPSIIKAQQTGLIEKILAYVDDNLSIKITLEDVASSLFTSKRTITREFQKNVGISFYNYVTQRRMDLARKLILDGVPLDKVYSATGFSDYSTFYRAFKKEFKCTPSQMQNQKDTFYSL